LSGSYRAEARSWSIGRIYVRLMLVDGAVIRIFTPIRATIGPGPILSLSEMYTECKISCSGLRFGARSDRVTGCSLSIIKAMGVCMSTKISSQRWNDNVIVRGVTGVACCMVLGSGPAIAQGYPSGPVRIVVPFTPGAGTDVVARTIAAKLTAAFGQNVLVENRPGAGGTIGSAMVAKAPADGHTILMGNTSTLAIAPALYPNLTYSPVRDFAPISLVTTTENVIVVHPSLPAKTVRDLIALAKARPGQILFASSGNGTTSHLGGELLKAMAGVDMVHVPYKGSPLATSELIAGQTQLSVSSLSTATPLITAGRLRAIATTGLKRNTVMPEIPTVDESGLKGYEINLWQGFVVPNGTPAEIQGQLNKAMVAAVRSPDVSSAFEKRGMHPAGTTVAEFDTFVKQEVARWADIVQRTGAKVQ
jgi:tripartite-type tricarboxylate transporter receptor subunit TctC